MSSEPRAVVMIVEDDASMRKLLRVTLTTAGYSVLEAADARAALGLAAHEMPDLIVQDLILPDSAGFQLVQELRALPGGSAVPIIALSGTQSRLDEAWRLRGGFSAYLRKPVEPSRLEEAVHAYLRPHARATAPLGQGRRVLVVDDNPAQAKLLSLQLADWGFDSVVTTTAADALAQARRDRPAAIVSDVLMPDMDGFHLCLEVRTDAGLADVPVVLVSAAAPEDADFDMARRVAATALVMGTPGFWGLHDAMARSLAADGTVAEPDGGGAALRLELMRRGARLQGPHGRAEREAGDGAARDPVREALAALARLAHLLAHRGDAHAVLAEALAEAAPALGREPCAVLLGDGSDELVLHGQHGASPVLLAALAALARQPERFAPMWAVGAPLVLAPNGDARVPVLLETLGAKAVSLTPLLASGRRVGALVVVHREAVPGDDRLALVQLVAGLIGPALALV